MPTRSPDGLIEGAAERPTHLAGRRVLVTGGAGFIGSHFVRHAIASGATVANIDALTYAGDRRRLDDLDGHPGYEFQEGCVTSPALRSLMSEFAPEIVVHCAAESHVTRSERDPATFERTNVEGTRAVLEAAAGVEVSLFVYASTDEVYGPSPSGAFVEHDDLAAVRRSGNAYARTKAAADSLASSFSKRLPVIVVRPTNIFGPHQFPEKAVPRWITRGLLGRTLPVWGDGLHVRQWLHVEDLIDALDLLIAKGDRGHAYNVAPIDDRDVPNVTIASWIAEALGTPTDRVELTAYDRPHHDRRYALNSDKIRNLGWSSGDLREQLNATVDWYRVNPDWWRPLAPSAEALYGPQ